MPPARGYVAVCIALLAACVAVTGCGSREPGGREPGGMESFSPVWSPDGRAIAFTVDPRPSEGCPYGSCVLGRYELWVMQADGTGARRLARGTSPSWSPDGRTIAFVWSGRSAEDDLSGIATIRADGSRRCFLTALMPHPNRRGPSWSPDGRRLTFANWGAFSEPNRLYVINADGTGLQRLTRLEPDEAAWSPDGTRIAVTALRSIYTVEPDGSHLVRLFSVEHVLGWSFAWSRDGERIVFDAGSGFGIVDRNGDVVLPPGRLVLGDPTTNERWATLSPDGRHVAFERAAGETTEVYVADADGTDAHRIATGSEPEWSPDGKRIAFSHDGDVYVIGADGTALTNLTTGLDVRGD